MAKGKFEQWKTPEGLLLLRAWARDGLTDEQIARNIGISRSTLSDWKNRFPDIADALKKGKDVVDVEVENALLRRALGYDYEESIEESTEEMVDGKVEKKTVRKVIKKHVPPDVTAQIFWLKNRRPQQWREKQQVDVNADVDNTLTISLEGELAEFIG